MEHEHPYPERERSAERERPEPEHRHRPYPDEPDPRTGRPAGRRTQEHQDEQTADYAFHVDLELGAPEELADDEASREVAHRLSEDLRYELTGVQRACRQATAAGYDLRLVATCTPTSEDAGRALEAASRREGHSFGDGWLYAPDGLEGLVADLDDDALIELGAAIVRQHAARLADDRRREGRADRTAGDGSEAAPGAYDRHEDESGEADEPYGGR